MIQTEMYRSRLMLSVFFLCLLMALSFKNAIAQEKVSLQVKTFDQDLKPLPDIQIAFNNLDFFSVGGKGTTFIEVDVSEIPVKSIRLKDEQFEAASWNLSKGTIEIIVRPVSYKVMHVSARFPDGSVLANTPVRFNGSTTINVTSDQYGKFNLPIHLHESIKSAGQFEIDNILISNMSVNDDVVTMLVERPRLKQPIPNTTARSNDPTLSFDVGRIDSIGSLTEFYAMFRNISINSLEQDLRLRIDEKFKQLVAKRQDSIRAAQNMYIKDISDTSLVIRDIRSLLKHATAERTTLHENRKEFENKIVVISSKLQRGVLNLTESERTSLMRDIDMLEQLLIENESQFYENHNDYREIINTLREKYLEVEQLQNRLSEAERLRTEQSREFRQRMVGIGAVVLVFGFLIILLITFSTRLRRQAKSLRVANERIEQINGNLEVMVARRTHLLEEANKELDTFLYRASHDLRSPVRSMTGLCQIIDHIDRNEMVDHVRLATDNMERVINKLVDISEISQETKNVKTISILDTINKIRNKHLVITVTSNRSRNAGAVIVRSKPIQFDVDCPEGLQMRTSPLLIDIILANLVDNAIFFGGLKKSNDAVRVEVKAKVHDNSLELYVRDNGVGISKFVQPRIFDMFFTGNEASKGSGLGLYTVRKCVTALHGTVAFETEEGKFTQFIVRIPVTSPS